MVSTSIFKVMFHMMAISVIPFVIVKLPQLWVALILSVLMLISYRVFQTMLGKNQNHRIRSNLDQTQAKKQLIVGSKPHNPTKGEYLLHELHVEIFARVSCCEYWKLQFLNKKLSQLLQSGNIFKARQERGLAKPYVFIRTNRDPRWTMFDKDFKNFLVLPNVPSDSCFINGDKETICAGTQLIVIGREWRRTVVWRYELAENKWFKGPAMITPRIMYGSASQGSDAFFAGGIKTTKNGITVVVSAAEKYNADTKKWTVIHKMHKRRQYCSGCFLRGKFYVIGGLDENNEFLTCGESYDEKTDSWKLIPNMLKDIHLYNFQSPPLISVVQGNLYLVETYSNELCVYDINTNSWKKLGSLPLRTDSTSGWGVAFKSTGDTLVLIGSLTDETTCEIMAIYTCRPSIDIKELIWVLDLTIIFIIVV